MLNWTCKYCEGANGQFDNTCKSCGAPKSKDTVLREQMFMAMLAEPNNNIVNIEVNQEPDVVMVSDGDYLVSKYDKMISDLEETEFENNRPGRWYYQTWALLDDAEDVIMLGMIISIIIGIIWLAISVKW